MAYTPAIDIDAEPDHLDSPAPGWSAAVWPSERGDGSVLEITITDASEAVKALFANGCVDAEDRLRARLAEAGVSSSVESAGWSPECPALTVWTPAGDVEQTLEGVWRAARAAARG